MMDSFAAQSASLRDGEPTPDGASATTTDGTAALSTEKERIKLAVPAAFSSDMQSSAQSRASAVGAEVYEAAIEELESELAEVQEQLQVRGGVQAVVCRMYQRSVGQLSCLSLWPYKSYSAQSTEAEMLNCTISSTRKRWRSDNCSSSS